MSVAEFVLLPSTEGTASVTGSPIRASGSFRNSGGYVVTVEATDMTEGRLYIEATMEGQPTGWFAIPIEDEDYIEFPNDADDIGGVQTYTIAFDGNFTWLRARLDRSYTSLPDPLDGHVVVSVAIDGYQGTTPSSTPPGGGDPVLSVSGESLGTGADVFAAKMGTSNVALTFRSLVAGNGVTITQNSTSIEIESESSSFVGLSDTANTVVTNSLVIGKANGVVGFSAAASNGTAVTFSAGEFTFTPLADITGSNSIDVERNGNAVVSAPTLNFTGNGVMVSNVAGVATIRIQSEADVTEYVILQYSPGGAGNLNTVDYLVAQTPGVTVEVIDPVNSIVAFTFENRLFPPSSIALMGQVRQTNEFSYSNVNPGIGTRKIAGGGTAASPTLMGSFSGPITLQLRMTDTGATAPAGQRAQAIIMFRF